MVDQLYIFVAGAVAFLATRSFIPICITIAHKLMILDRPDGALKLQKAPVPYLGGLAVYGGFMTALALFFPFENREFLLFIGCTLLLFLGLVDDIIALRPWQKFVGQMVVAIAFLKAGFYLKGQFFEGASFATGVLVKAGSFLWLLTIMNAFNLVDVMDGLSSTIALCSAAGFLAIAWLCGLQSVAILLAAFMGALFAFFLVNRPPSAAMYLGDAGSLFIGGFLAVVPFMISWGKCSPFGFLAAIAILLIPLLEVSGLIVLRTYVGIPFYMGSPHHFSILLRKKGLSKASILAIVALLSLLLNGAALLFVQGFVSLYFLILYLITLALLWFLGLAMLLRF